jgi:hypothetical protein
MGSDEFEMPNRLVKQKSNSFRESKNLNSEIRSSENIFK